MVNALWCAVELWMHLVGFLSWNELEVLIRRRHQRPQSEYEARLRYWILLGEYSSYVKSHE